MDHLIIAVLVMGTLIAACVVPSCVRSPAQNELILKQTQYVIVVLLIVAFILAMINAGGPLVVPGTASL